MQDNIKEALEKTGWEYLTLNGLCYKTETVLTNRENAEWLAGECEIEEYREDWMDEQDVERIIRLRNQDPIEEAHWTGAIDNQYGGGFRRNGLILN